ncbi:uncharacterized protein B0H18DRAFT_987125 [Fomitopsis serialis]|uniref:uncharacterized protein n=1 Tax=Fomitopsis serialis TaxID=139415 RepID=UPI00200775E7|nr:uncharacterized protein B0H18DRAFT_987125 [Neoantrodia serialis]KAH9932223.1 hypothetical protein B0H18DRAFT_987125 [Neoantrodia serialis]
MTFDGQSAGVTRLQLYLSQGSMVRNLAALNSMDLGTAWYAADKATLQTLWMRHIRASQHGTPIRTLSSSPNTVSSCLMR